MQTVQELIIERGRIQKKIFAIQESCEHKHTVKIAKSNTGGYDGPAFDRYWYDYYCITCEKSWTEDQ